MDTRHYAVLLAGVVVLSAGAATAVPSGATSLQQETATVSFTDQTVEDGAVTVDSVTLPEGGFVAIHAVEDGEPGEILGTTDFLEAGTATDVEAELDEDLEEEQDLVAMAHMDTDGDETFDFVETDGAEDGPYTDEDGEAVTDTATVAPSMDDGDGAGPPDDAGQPDEAGPPADETETADEATPEAETPEVETPEDEEPDEMAEAGQGLVVTDLDAPADATIGQTLSVTATVENRGENETTQTVEFRFDGGLVAGQSVTLDDGESETVTFDVQTGLYNLDEGQFRHGVFTEDDWQLATINLTQSFRVTDIEAPEEAEVGDNVTVNATIENPNDAPSSQDVDFRFNGAIVDSTVLSLDGNESETVTLAVNSSGVPAGNYTHGVFTRTDGQFADIELVNASEPEEPTETPVNATETPEPEEPTETPTNATETAAPAEPTETPMNVTETPATEAPATETETVAPAEPTETAVSVTETPVGAAPTTEGAPTATETPTNTTETPNETATPLTGVPLTEVQETTTEVPTTEAPGTETPSETDNATSNVTGNATVSFPDQAGDGRNVTVENVSLPEGGFIAIHDDTLFEGDAVGSVVGTSAFLEPGEYENVTIRLFNVSGATYENDTLTEGQTLVAMPHRDTNGNSTYDFVATNGSADGPYLNETGDPVVDAGRVIVETGTPTG